jgi:hypothetical protein
LPRGPHSLRASSSCRAFAAGARTYQVFGLKPSGILILTVPPDSSMTKKPFWTACRRAMGLVFTAAIAA